MGKEMCKLNPEAWKLFKRDKLSSLIHEKLDIVESAVLAHAQDTLEEPSVKVPPELLDLIKRLKSDGDRVKTERQDNLMVD